jgi:hypothetical protein
MTRQGLLRSCCAPDSRAPRLGLGETLAGTSASSEHSHRRQNSLFQSPPDSDQRDPLKVRKVLMQFGLLHFSRRDGKLYALAEQAK